jgi:hypothetical protein
MTITNYKTKANAFEDAEKKAPLSSVVADVN